MHTSRHRHRVLHPGHWKEIAVLTDIGMIEFSADASLSLQLLEVALGQLPGVDDLRSELQSSGLLDTSPDYGKSSFSQFILKVVVVREASRDDRCSHFRTAGPD